ncbi:DUF7222 domain-containing protein [Bacillus sp. Brlt_9]|uniref:DUF7222 domain-containing protein n=1 Tax=Bacillus sp. Brlt_9 TaxID=3110916 RepID=UPI003F7C5E8C
MNNLQLAVKEIIENNGGIEFAEEVLQYGCQSGIVTELIYYTDTQKWFDTYYDEIMELKEHFEDMTGQNLNPQGDLKNWYAWFSFEETVLQLYSG